MSRPPTAKTSRESDVHLRVLCLTDLHMDIRGYDYFNDRPAQRGGLARASTLIDQLRSEAPNCLLFDNGDILQGNPMGDFSAERITRDAHFRHPMIDAMNRLNLDAATLGNHEFNYGLPVLRSALRHARFPVVSANVALSLGGRMEEDTHLVPPYVLLDRVFTDHSGHDHPFSIGVLGLLPPQILAWDRRHLAGQVETRDIVETAAHYTAKMRSEGADLIAVLCHSGIEDVTETDGLENAVLPVAALDEVDIVIAGHSHQVFPSPEFAGLTNVDAARGMIFDTPVCMAGFSGSHVGQIDLLLTREGRQWQVQAAKVSAVEVTQPLQTTAPTVAAILEATQEAHEETLHHIRQPVGMTDRSLDSIFAMVEPSTAVRLVATAQARHLKTALQGTPFAELPLLSAAAPFKMGARGGPDHYTEVPVGAVSLRNVADLYGFPNLIRAVRVSGAALRDWLEHSVGIFAQIVPGRSDQPLIDTQFAAHSFDTITGLTYAIDLTAPARFHANGHLASTGTGRIRYLQWNGGPVTDEMEFLVATNDYRASRSGTYPGADAGEIVYAPEESLRDVLTGFFRETPADRSLAPAPWRFLPVNRASVTFETGPAALHYPDRLRELSIEPIGRSEAGFLRCRKVLG